MILNSLSTWLEHYLAETLGATSGFEWAPGTTPTGNGVLVTVGFMPEQPAELVTITGYSFPEGTAPGSVAAYIQIRTRAATRARALELAAEATSLLTDPAVTTRLDAVTRTTIQPIGQDQMGLHEATASLTVNTIERTP